MIGVIAFIAPLVLLLVVICVLASGQQEGGKLSSPVRPDRLFTIGRWETQKKYRDSEKPYSVSIFLRESSSGKKDLIFQTSEDFGREDLDKEYNSARNNVLSWVKRQDIYQLKLVPWLEGTYTTEDLKIMETGITWIEKPVVSTLITSEGSL